MEMLRKLPRLLWEYGVFVVFWLKRLLLHALEAEIVVKNVVEELPIVMVHNPSKEAVIEEPTKTAVTEDPTKKVVTEEPTKKAIIEDQAGRRLKANQRKRLKAKQKKLSLNQTKKTELPSNKPAEMEDRARKTTHPDGFLKKFPGSDSKVIEACLKHTDKHMVFTRGIMWDITPPLLGIEGDRFSIVTRAVYFASSIDWQCDATVRLAVSCQEDPSIRIERPEVKMRPSNLSGILGYTFQKPADWSDEKWKKLDWLRMEITVENFEGHCDSIPSIPSVTDMEDPSIRHDRVLVIEGRKIFVQSGILSMWSEYFNSMFNSSFKEAGMKEIIIDDMSADEFIAMLHVLYSSEHPITVDSLESLLALADLLIMPCLTIKCCLFIGSLPQGTIDETKLRYLTDTYRLLEGEESDEIDEILSSYNEGIEYSWKYHFESKLEALQLDMEKSSVLHDRVIAIGGRRILVQSEVLASYSSYFASLFDSIEDPTQDIPLTDVSADEFIQLLHCIYPYQTPIEDCDMEIEVLLRLAKQFEIPSLTDRCALHLCTLEYRDMQLIPMVQLAFEYKLDQVKSWLFAKASRGLHGCMRMFHFKNRELLDSLPDDVNGFFGFIFEDWWYISCPMGSECHPNPNPHPVSILNLGGGLSLIGL